MFKNQAWRLRLLISNNVKQFYNIWPTAEVLQNLNLSLNLHQEEAKYVRDEFKPS